MAGFVSFKGNQVERLEKVINAFKNKQVQSRKDNHRSLVVGFLAPYAIYVHERTDLYHEPPTQAKFLEATIRRVKGVMAKIIYAALKAKKTLPQAQIEAGEYLLAQTIPVTPVDTGYLRSSGFVRLDKV